MTLKDNMTILITREMFKWLREWVKPESNSDSVTNYCEHCKRCCMCTVDVEKSLKDRRGVDVPNVEIHPWGC